MKRLHMMMEQNDSITEGQVASVHEYTIANEELQKEKEIFELADIIVDLIDNHKNSNIEILKQEFKAKIDDLCQKFPIIIQQLNGYGRKFCK